jgi:hypothetical protein
MGWIRDPEKLIPDPDPGAKKPPDPGSVSVTLAEYFCTFQLMAILIAGCSRSLCGVLANCSLRLHLQVNLLLESIKLLPYRKVA